MSQCQGTTKAGKPCTRLVHETFCWQHSQTKTNQVKTGISGNRQVGDLTLFDNLNPELWEAEYVRIMDPKYAKGTKNFNPKFGGQPWTEDGDPPIYLIPRTRGGPSYKSISLVNSTSDQVYFCPISKGFPQQDVSSFTLGPIVGEGLCLVNSAFSKRISVWHIEGGGQLDLKRKTFWRPSKTPDRRIQLLPSDTMLVNGMEVNIRDWVEKNTSLDNIQFLSPTIISDNGVNIDIQTWLMENNLLSPNKIQFLPPSRMLVDGVNVNIQTWLRENENLWLDEWNNWRKHVALCSMGDFHWSGNSPTVGYRFQDQYLTFVEWKKRCYIQPSYELMVKGNKVMNHLWSAWKEHKRPLGLVHPKARSESAEQPITKEFLQSLFNSPTEMCCQPYVVAGLLLGVPV